MDNKVFHFYGGFISYPLLCFYPDNYRLCQSSGLKFTGRDEQWKTNWKFFFPLIYHVLYLACHISRNQLLITWHIISFLSLFLVDWFCLSGRPWRRGWECRQALLPGLYQDFVGRHLGSGWGSCTCVILISASVLCGCQQVPFSL